jgi:LPXTG-motif cell wall-anchored protein
MKLRVLCILSIVLLTLGGAAVAQDTTQQNLNQPATATQPADDPNDPDDEGQVDIDTGIGSEADAEIRAGVDADADVAAELNDDEADTGFGADNEIDNDLDDTDDTLPQTASPLALLALAGGASLAGALGLRRRR